MKKRFILAVLATVMMLLATGCGDELIPLTDSERTQIVQFSAHVIGEFNKDQTEGFTPLTKKQLDNIRKEQEAAEEVQPEEDNTTDQTPGVGNGTDNNESATEAVTTLTDVLDIAGITAEVKGYQTQKDYVQGDVFAVTADDGNIFIVLNVELKNTSSEKITCDMLDKNLELSLRINGQQTTKALFTVIPNDLLSYFEDIQAGKTKDAILLFEVSEKTGSDINSLELLAYNGASARRIIIK